MKDAFFITAKDLAAAGPDGIPDELTSAKHMIYSSPATLDFNSPGAKGFGVKRAGLAIPGSVMLLVAPGCCGRNTGLLTALGYDERFFYLLLDDTDIVTGRHLTKVPKAVVELVESLDEKPSCVMICITCVDALLGTDMERVCRKCTEAAGVPVAPAYMYALTREKRLPPMAGIRKSVYSLLEKQEKRVSNECTLMGFFSQLDDECELYKLLEGIGIKKVHELARKKTFEDYLEISRSNFSIVLNPEARYAAQEMEERLGIPFIEINRFYRIDKIRIQYKLLAQALGAEFRDEDFYDEAWTTCQEFKRKHAGLNVAVGECVNADSFELSLALTEYGCHVREIYGTVTERNFPFVRKLAEVSPETKIYSNLSPTMMNYESDGKIDLYVGNDAGYYHPSIPGVDNNDEIQPYGYFAVKNLLTKIDKALEGGERL